jgi:hypothetical protein
MPVTGNEVVGELASSLLLGALLARVGERWGGYTLVDHWRQGEFHHDVVLRVAEPHADLPGPILVIATNCNGGIKEVLCFAELPQREALWHFRCPDNPEFSGTLPRVLAASVTEHWFDPCELLAPDARSEYRSEFRERQCGGGWLPRKVTA